MERRFGEPVTGWTAPPRPGPEAISGRYVRLERLNAGRHAASLGEAFSGDDSAWDYMAYGPFASTASHRRWVEEMSERPDSFFYAICDSGSGRALGVASWLRIDPSAGSIEVGSISFSAALRGSIGATEAMVLMMAWAFGVGYRRYEWKCDALNLASRRAAQRLGFSYEGTFRQATVYKGRNRDTAWFAVIDKDWPGLRMAYDQWLSPGNFDETGRQRQRLSALTRPLRVSDDPLLE